MQPRFPRRREEVQVAVSPAVEESMCVYSQAFTFHLLTNAQLNWKLL